MCACVCARFDVLTIGVIIIIIVVINVITVVLPSITTVVLACYSECQMRERYHGFFFSIRDGGSIKNERLVCEEQKQYHRFFSIRDGGSINIVVCVCVRRSGNNTSHLSDVEEKTRPT